MDAQTPELPLTGGCMCGAVRYAVDAPLESAGYCHCTRCQRRTGGSASITARAPAGSFRVTSGEEHVAVFQPDDGYGKAFCSRCGSALWAQSPDDPPKIGPRMGTFDGEPGVRPSFHQFVAYSAAWDPIPDDGLPRYDERRPT